MAADRVVLTVEGLMLERLIDRAVLEGARFSKVRRTGRRQLTIETDSRGAAAIKALAERYRLDCKIISLGGISAGMAWLKRRATVAAAFITAAALCALFFSHIWTIEIDLIRGDSLPPGTESVLADSGILKGAYAGAADTALAAVRLMALEGCAHASVTRRGVRVVVEIACEEPQPELYSIESSGDLVAVRDGIVASVNVKSGTAMVKPGDTVRKGQVLIAGYERLSKESFREVGALGSVTARCWAEGEAESAVTAFEKRYTGRESTSASVACPWLDVPLTHGESYEFSDIRQERLNIGGLFIPLYIETVTRREYVLTPVRPDMDALKALLQAESEKNALQKVPESAEIIDKWTDFSMIESEDIIHARTVIETESEIAVTRGYMEENQID